MKAPTNPREALVTAFVFTATAPGEEQAEEMLCIAYRLIIENNFLMEDVLTAMLEAEEIITDLDGKPPKIPRH